MFLNRWCHQLVLVALSFNLFLHQVSGALDIEYCSSLNTASTAKNISIYQSNGLCYDFCISKYAFAVLQYDGCWCSNYAPGTTTTGCTYQCPGYPTDFCGGDGLYGYIALASLPSGTEGAIAATSSKSPTTSAAAQVTVTAIPAAVTIFQTPVIFSSVESSSTSSSSPTALTTVTTSSSGSSSSSSTWTPTPITSLETVTGQVRTVTVTPTVPPTSGSSAGVTKDTGKTLSTGAAIGLTVGIVSLIAIIASIVLCCLRKRRQAKAEEYNDMSRRESRTGLGSAGAVSAPSRTMSQNSHFLLKSDGRQVVETWEPGNAPGVRQSRLKPVDQRLNPYSTVYQRGENKSRESVNTIRDDHDYSRRVAGPGPILRATNPDEPEQ